MAMLWSRDEYNDLMKSARISAGAGGHQYEYNQIAQDFYTTTNASCLLSEPSVTGTLPQCLAVNSFPLFCLVSFELTALGATTFADVLEQKLSLGKSNPSAWLRCISSSLPLVVRASKF